MVGYSAHSLSPAVSTRSPSVNGCVYRFAGIYLHAADSGLESWARATPIFIRMRPSLIQRGTRKKEEQCLGFTRA